MDDLVAQMAESMRLYCRYDWAVKRTPQLTATLAPLRDTHLAHALTLAGAAVQDLGEHDAAALLSTLAETERSARDTAIAACLAASRGEAALLGEIAAARAAHAFVLAEELVP